MWPFSEPSLETATKLSDFANCVLIGSLLAGVAATFVIVQMGNIKEAHWDRERELSRERISNLDTTAANLLAEAEGAEKQIAQANVEAAKANERTAAVESANLKLATRIAPRRIGQVARFLIAPFAPMSGKTVRISSYALDAEGAVLAQQIIDLLRASGLSVQDNRMSVSSFGGMGFGVFVYGQNQILADLIFRLLNTLGVSVSMEEEPKAAGVSLGDPQGQQADAVVFVGIKPIAN